MHTWDYENYQYDSESGKDKRTCTVCEYVDEKDHVHLWKLTSTTTSATCVTKGEGGYKCSGCEGTKTDVIPELYSSPVDAETLEKATSSSKYVYFGVFPRTVKKSSITVDEKVSETIGANTYYKGNDGEWYVKIVAKSYNGSTYKYSDGTSIAEVDTYFKVEPIKWKVLTTDYNGSKKALLLADQILTANVPYYKYYKENNTRTVGDDTEIYINNYKYSQIRAYLNGLDYYYDTSSTETTKKTDYTDKGFLQTAFTQGAQALIAETTVDNSADSTTDAGNNIEKATKYVCANTIDKIFLLSEKEVTTTAYGFAAYNDCGTDNTRIRISTDYARANNVYQEKNTGNGYWWLRSPYDYSFKNARRIFIDGNTYQLGEVSSQNNGIVPALTMAF